MFGNKVLEAIQVFSIDSFISAVAPRIVGPSFRLLDVLANQTVDVDCEVEATPAPVISWLHNGKPVAFVGNVEVC